MTHNSLRLAHVWLDEYKVSVVSHCFGGAFCASLACVPWLTLTAMLLFSGLLLTRAHAVVVLIRSFLSVMLQQQSSSMLCAGPH